MRRPTTLFALVTLLLIGQGCSQNPAPTFTEPTAAAPPPAPAPIDPVLPVMQAKLDHSRDILEGLARGDFDTVEHNARQLEWLSREASWMVTDSVTYVLYSDQFRQTAGDLADHAQRQNLERATLDFMQIVQTCVACHTYLRKERMSRDFPERISMVLDPQGLQRGSLP